MLCSSFLQDYLLSVGPRISRAFETAIAKYAISKTRGYQLAPFETGYIAEDMGPQAGALAPRLAPSLTTYVLD